MAISGKISTIYAFQRRVNYIFEERDEVQKYFDWNYLKVSVSGEAEGEKNIPFSDYCQYIGQALRLDNYESYFKQYLKDNEAYETLLESELMIIMYLDLNNLCESYGN